MDYRALYIRLAVLGFLFLLVLAYGFRKSQSWRNRYFAAMAILLPFTGLAALEYTTGSLRLDQVLLGNYELVVDRPVHKDFDEWVRRIQAADPDYDRRGRVLMDGFEFYHPIEVPGLYVNSLGLRAREPVPKPPGVWRIAILGGSTVWSRYVFDSETIPGYLERYYHQAGASNVEVYNLGLEGMGYASSVRLLEKFQPLYNFDEVVFYQGVNDLTVKGRKLAGVGEREGFRSGLLSALSQFYLWRLLLTTWNEVTRPVVQSDAPAFSAIVHEKITGYKHSYRAASHYCARVGLKCSYFLQPTLYHKLYKTETEALIWRNHTREHPWQQAVYDQSVDIIVGTLAGHHDLRNVVAGVPEGAFMDWCHATTVANAVIAGQIFGVLNEPVH